MLESISMAERTVTVAEFLFTRLHQLGCHSLHGLPGDFNLLALDYVSKSGLTWVGNCNELNAGIGSYKHDVVMELTVSRICSGCLRPYPRAWCHLHNVWSWRAICC
jgi:hypothetical protein